LIEKELSVFFPTALDPSKRCIERERERERDLKCLVWRCRGHIEQARERERERDLK